MRTAAALLALLLASPALAGGTSEGGEMRLAGVGPFGLVAGLNRDIEETGIGTWRRDVSAAGLAFQHDGFKAALTAGFFTYDFTGAGQGRTPMASFAVSHETAFRAGTLSIELRQGALFGDNGRLDFTNARVGWLMRF